MLEFKIYLIYNMRNQVIIDKMGKFGVTLKKKTILLIFMGEVLNYLKFIHLWQEELEILKLSYYINL